ncbi:MAG: hypothetical protein ACJA01_001243 [Saprospiraceae bacterium]|jgi:uncharacterized protein (DUF697 family)
MENKVSHANTIVKNHIIWSMGAGFIPVPFADLFAVTAIQLDMIRQLSNLYDVDFKETSGKAIITSLSGASVARMGARAIKFIPGVGSIMGGVTLAVLSGASTYALGEVFKSHFDNGGTFLDFDVSRIKRMYDEKFEKGKEVVKDIKKEQEEMEQKAAQADADPLVRLKELAKMKEDGHISEEEFNLLKSKLIKDLS